VIQHILANEQRYTIQTHWAALRYTRGQHGEPEGPIRPPNELLPDTVGAGLAHGSLASVRAEVLAGHAAAVRTVMSLTDEQLTGETDWVGIRLDVRFRVHRFAAHERQHLIHLIKTLRGVGFQQTEAQLILAEAEMARMQLVALTQGLPDTLAEGPLGGAAVNPMQLLAEAGDEERALVSAAQVALGD
jgi:hypothetical protein